MFAKTNIEDKLRNVRNRKHKADDILEAVHQILDEHQNQRDDISTRLAKMGKQTENLFNLDLLETDRIFPVESIKKICVDYRLRFVDSGRFVPDIPEEAVSEIQRLEKEHETTLEGFKIMAPAKLLKLDNADDPLLFAPIGNEYYYLIHKWGNDLHPMRKLLMWPYKNFDNLIFTVFVLSILLTAITPMQAFTKLAPTMTEYVLLFLFMFKAVGGVVLYYGFAAGKNFNEAIWNSNYYNG